MESGLFIDDSQQVPSSLGNHAIWTENKKCLKPPLTNKYIYIDRYSLYTYLVNDDDDDEDDDDDDDDDNHHHHDDDSKI